MKGDNSVSTAEEAEYPCGFCVAYAEAILQDLQDKFPMSPLASKTPLFAGNFFPKSGGPRPGSRIL